MLLIRPRQHTDPVIPSPFLGIAGYPQAICSLSQNASSIGIAAGGSAATFGTSAAMDVGFGGLIIGTWPVDLGIR
jgi:hypothetical protein